MNAPNTPHSKAEQLSAVEIGHIFDDKTRDLRRNNPPEVVLATMKTLLTLLDTNITEDGSNLDMAAFKTLEGYLLRMGGINLQLSYTIRIMEGINMRDTNRGVDKPDVLPLPESLQSVASSLYEKLKSRRASLGVIALTESVQTSIVTVVA